MKTFQEFIESAAASYEQGKREYERTGKVRRQRQLHQAHQEAGARQQQSDRFTQTMQQRAAEIRQDSEETIQHQKQKTEASKKNRQAKAQQQRERTAKIASGVRKFVKGILRRRRIARRRNLRNQNRNTTTQS